MREWFASLFVVQVKRNYLEEEVIYLRDRFNWALNRNIELQEELKKLAVRDRELISAQELIELYQSQLSLERHEVKLLTDKLFESGKAINREVNEVTFPPVDDREEDKKPINRSQHTPWHVTQRRLEAEDRLKAEKLRDEAVKALEHKAAELNKIDPNNTAALEEVLLGKDKE